MLIMLYGRNTKLNNLSGLTAATFANDSVGQFDHMYYVHFSDQLQHRLGLE